jgi:hypothetical protein
MHGCALVATICQLFGPRLCLKMSFAELQKHTPQNILYGKVKNGNALTASTRPDCMLH